MSTYSEHMVKYRSYETTKYKSPVYIGTWPTGHWELESGDYTVTSDTPIRVRSDLVTSFNVQNPRLKDPVYRRWVPRKYPLEPPVEPVLYRIPLPVLKPRREGQSASSWNRALAKYRRIRDKVLIANGRNELRYLDRLAKYKKRFANYERLSQLAKYGFLSYRALDSCRDSEWHPYTRVRKIYIPDTGFSFDAERDIVGVTQNGYPVYSNSYAQGLGTYKSGVYDWPSQYGNPVEPRTEILELQEKVSLSAESMALSRLFDRMNQQDVHVGNLLAERHQSIEMIRSLILRAVALLKGRTLSRSAKVLPGTENGRLDNDFLMFQFGLRPLMQDIFTIAKQLHIGATVQNSDRVYVRASAKGTPQRFTVEEVIVSGSSSYVSDYELNESCRYVLEYRVINQPLQTLQSYGLVNPLEIAWELTPWSFVVDWFLPIGKWIRDAKAVTNLEFIRGTKSTTQRQVVTRRYQASGPPPLPVGNHSYVSIIETKQRVLLTEVPTVKFPKVKNPLTHYHIAEALALFTQRFR